MYFHQTFKLQMHDPMESKHLNNVFEPFLSAPFLLLLSSRDFTTCKVIHSPPSSQRKRFLHPNYPMQSNIWPLFSSCRCKRSEKVIAVFPWPMLHPGCSLTSAPAAPRTRWSPVTEMAHAHPAAHHPYSREYLCAGLQGHNRHYPHAQEHKRERLRVLERRQVAAGFSPHYP